MYQIILIELVFIWYNNCGSNRKDCLVICDAAVAPEVALLTGVNEFKSERGFQDVQVRDD